jgi:amidase
LNEPVESANDVIIPGFLSVADALNALRSRTITSHELVTALRSRILRHNPTLNAIILDRLDQAEVEARRADKLRSEGVDAPFLGLPVSIKESIDVAGLPATSGMPEFADRVPDYDAPLVRKLNDAGAIILGKTNLPYSCNDWQANSPIYGTTNNPWDLSRTPGGSTGGGAAALAAGMTLLEIGSDIGGSVRVPAAFCGIYGHRQSETLIAQSGHFPGHKLPNRSVVLNIMGPLARSAKDLELALEVMAGPELGEDVAWRVELPPARHEALCDFRVAVFPDLDWLPVSEDVRAGRERVVDALTRAGAAVEYAAPEGFRDLKEFHRTYCRILRVVTSVDLDEDAKQDLIEMAQQRGDQFDGTVADALNGSPADFIIWHANREMYRQAYRDFFHRYDILLAPITLTTAFKHIPSTRAGLDDYLRSLTVDGLEIPYDYQVVYPGLATLCGQPATAFPTGLGRDGLPVSMQAIGPYLEDRTPIRFAELMAHEIGGFQAPPDFA